MTERNLYSVTALQHILEDADPDVVFRALEGLKVASVWTEGASPTRAYFRSTLRGRTIAGVHAISSSARWRWWTIGPMDDAPRQPEDEEIDDLPEMVRGIVADLERVGADLEREVRQRDEARASRDLALAAEQRALAAAEALRADLAAERRMAQGEAKSEGEEQIYLGAAVCVVADCPDAPVWLSPAGSGWCVDHLELALGDVPEVARLSLPGDGRAGGGWVRAALAERLREEADQLRVALDVARGAESCAREDEARLRADLAQAEADLGEYRRLSRAVTGDAARELAEVDAALSAWTVAGPTRCARIGYLAGLASVAVGLTQPSVSTIQRGAP